MAWFVADTSSLVSLGAAAELQPSPFERLSRRHDVAVPPVFVSELRSTSSYEDRHGKAAGAALERVDRFEVRGAGKDPSFPLDEGENAAVALANDLNADLFLCDEFNELPLVHASLTDTRLVTTPTLLRVFREMELLSSEESIEALSLISELRSWDGNSYVERVRETLNR